MSIGGGISAKQQKRMELTQDNAANEAFQRAIRQNRGPDLNSTRKASTSIERSCAVNSLRFCGFVQYLRMTKN